MCFTVTRNDSDDGRMDMGIVGARPFPYMIVVEAYASIKCRVNMFDAISLPLVNCVIQRQYFLSILIGAVRVITYYRFRSATITTRFFIFRWRLEITYGEQGINDIFDWNATSSFLIKKD